MNPLLTNSEFQEAFSSLGIHHAPEGYWDEIMERRKHDKNVGRKAYVNGKQPTCKQADLEMAIFDDPVRMSDGNISHGDIIITGDDFYKITWKTDNNKGEKS